MGYGLWREYGTEILGRQRLNDDRTFNIKATQEFVARNRRQPFIRYAFTPPLPRDRLTASGYTAERHS